MRPPLAALLVVLAGCAHPQASAARTEGGEAGTGERVPSGGGDSSGDDDGDSSGDSSGPPTRGDAEASSSFVVRGATVVGLGRVDLRIEDGRVVELGSIPASPFDLDARGQFIAPAFIDSHVHLAYAFDAPTLAAGGIAAAIDLAAPLSFLDEDHTPLQVRAAGPMITAMGGYPTQGWGAGGFGLEVSGADAVREAVDQLVDAGAALIKVPIGEAPTLGDAELIALVAQAHRRGVPVVAHALTDADASRAAIADVDILAHTPTERLAEATVLAWSSRAVISTLDAFGGTADTIDNLRRLREAGATVLYGTDLGNTGIPAIDRNELALLAAAGLDGAEILAAGTTTPAATWGLEGLGALDVGARASFLVLESDPQIDPQTLASPVAVYIDGQLQHTWTAGDGIKN